MVIVIVMVASCILLVGISYFMLDILSGMIVVPKTKVKEIAGEGELVVPVEEAEVLCMQASADGRFLAFIGGTEGSEGAVLRVVGLDGDAGAVFEREISGRRLAWLGDTSRVAFEDADDIHLLDMDGTETRNLTESPEKDSDPIPSPDGRYILWTVSPAAASGDAPAFWLMGAEGEDKTFLAEAQDLAAWDTSGLGIISRRGTAVIGEEESYRHLLQTAVPGRRGWEHYADCEGEVYFIWWLREDTVLYVGPTFVKGQDRVKGTWSRVEPPDKIKRVASTDGLGYEISYYDFYPSRTDERLAYVGERGLEYLDHGERVIYRYTGLEARTPLAWNEAANEILFVGRGGIRRMGAGGD
ncbi:MAG: hypothetical protein PHP28_02090 [Actinomycetota bacterium]|jgi:hypothetical protein|nr:hypothetical protein [Actinomycetota bacterium]MDD5666193.1 hypothetical protein [Actinomycetota bacterium]